MAKVGNEAKLILSLAEEKIRSRIDKLNSNPDSSFSDKFKARREGLVQGLEEAQSVYRDVVAKLERGS